MDVHALLSLLGEKSGIPLTLSEVGTLALLFEGDVTLNLEYAASNDALYLYAVVGDIPYDDQARLSMYGAMLEANLFGHETGGGTLAVDDTTGELMLTRHIELAVADVEHLSRAIEQLVSAAAEWRKRLDSPLAFDEDSALLDAGADAAALNVRV